MNRSPTPELRSGEQVDGERHHLARDDFGQLRRRNREGSESSPDQTSYMARSG
jgi:hypothetical protein